MQTSPALTAALTMQLAEELGDAALAQQLAAVLLQDTLLWHAPEMPPHQARAIFAFTFGNRMMPNGNRLPGPVNEQLAEQVLALRRLAAVPVFAQWEIADALNGRMPANALTAIYPGRDARGEPVYLGTGQVVAEIARRVGAPQALGPVAVVAFSDHLYRAVAAARAAGFAACAPGGLRMPTTYDSQSGQPWCRSRLAYLLHDIMIRVSDRRAAAVGGGWS